MLTERHSRVGIRRMRVNVLPPDSDAEKPGPRPPLQLLTEMPRFVLSCAAALHSVGGCPGACCELAARGNRDRRCCESSRQPRSGVASTLLVVVGCAGR